MDIKDVARKGGKATALKYGSKYMSELGSKGVASLKEKYGDDYYKKIRRGEKPASKIGT